MEVTCVRADGTKWRQNGRSLSCENVFLRSAQALVAEVPERNGQKVWLSSLSSICLRGKTKAPRRVWSRTTVIAFQRPQRLIDVLISTPFVLSIPTVCLFIFPISLKGILFCTFNSMKQLHISHYHGQASHIF